MEWAAVVPGPVPGRGRVVVLGDTTDTVQQEREPVGRDLVGTVLGDVGDDDTVVVGGLHVDVLEAHARACDDLKFGEFAEHARRDGRVHVDDERRGVGAGLQDRVLVG